MSFFGIGRPAQPSQREQFLEVENTELKREVARLLVTTSTGPPLHLVCPSEGRAVGAEILMRCGYACLLMRQEANTALDQKVNSLLGKFEAPIGNSLADAHAHTRSGTQDAVQKKIDQANKILDLKHNLNPKPGTQDALQCFFDQANVPIVGIDLNGLAHPPSHSRPRPPATDPRTTINPPSLLSQFLFLLLRIFIDAYTCFNHTTHTLIVLTWSTSFCVDVYLFMMIDMCTCIDMSVFVRRKKRENKNKKCVCVCVH